MKNNQNVVRQRRKEILDMILSAGEVTVEDIAQAHSVSNMTIRRDLQYLEDHNLIWRTHGVANSPAKIREIKNIRGDLALCRDSISEYAARFVNDGDTLFINGSRTALNMLKYVDSKNVLVYTNNAWAVGEKYPEGITICLTGGELRNYVMVGEYVMRYLLSISVDKIFLGCAAIYDDGELRYDIPTEIGINEALLSRTDSPLYVLADSSKLLQRAQIKNTYGSSSYDKPVTLITDEKSDTVTLDKLRERGMEIITVPIHSKK